MIMTISLFSACAGTINTSTLDYYRVALVSVDEAVKSGMQYSVENLPRSCYLDDACVDRNLRKWFIALSTVQVASKYLQTAYTSPNNAAGIKAIVCSVSNLREVNAILIGAKMEIPTDYQAFFVFLDSQTRGMTCEPSQEQTS